VDSTKQYQTNISLCTGSRGLEHGIERTGIKLKTLADVEVEAFVCENLVQQMEQGILDEAPIWTNLKTFNGRPFRGMVDGITGGYPCQPFSVAGKRKGKLDPRHLWPYIGGFGEKSIVGTVRPLWCLFENVVGHLELGYREVKQDLESLGYTVKEGIFSAEEVGAPHQRKRLFILAVDNTYCERLKQEYQIQARRQSIESSSKELADCHSIGHVHIKLEKHTTKERFDALGDTSTGGRNELEHTSSEGLERSIGRISERDGTEQSSKVADTCKYNVQRIERRSPDTQERTKSGERHIGSQSIRDRWPARPGQPQFEWEEPRVESRVGFSVDGYNFREDLLRMAGNAVVPQQAELAWITLWNKIYERTLS